ncbi:hypothetical protein DRO32_05615, partial [Candidatus Bathyarchaeota archaeon]
TLGVGVGDTVALITGSRRGMLSGDLFVVRGVFRSGSRMDKEVALLPLSAAQDVLETRGVSAVPLVLTRVEEAGRVARELQEKLGPEYEVKDVMRAMPVVKYLLEIAKEEKYILVVLVYAIAALGVLNTTLMAVMERTRELGVLYALGMSRAKVAVAFLWEGFFVYLYGAIPGAGFGSALVWLLTKTGIPLPGLAELSQEYNLFTGGAVHPELRATTVLAVLAISLVMTLLALSFPLVRALRVQPAKAMRL